MIAVSYVWRDAEIVRLPGEGKTQREIAGVVGVSQDTVKNVERKRNSSEIVHPDDKAEAMFTQAVKKEQAEILAKATGLGSALL